MLNAYSHSASRKIRAPEPACYYPRQQTIKLTGARNSNTRLLPADVGWVQATSSRKEAVYCVIHTAAGTSLWHGVDVKQNCRPL